MKRRGSIGGTYVLLRSDLLPKSWSQFMASTTKKSLSGMFSERNADIAAYGAIVLAVIVFFADALFGGKNFLSDGDNVAFYSFVPYLDAAKQSGEFPLWMPYIFSGMPSLASFLAAGERHWDFLGALIFSLPRAIGDVFNNDTARLATWYTIYGWGVYTLMRVKGHTRTIGSFSALAAIFSTFVIVWVMIGHSTKPVSLATLPWILLALERLRERFTLANLFLLILPLIVLVTATHPQMMFYVGCATALYLLVEVVTRVITKQGWMNVLKAAGGLAVAGAIAIGTHADMFLATREYTPQSTRGSAPLVQSDKNKIDQTGGNDYEYATNWSFSPAEMATFFIPNYFGFGNTSVKVPGQAKEQRTNLYWGQMPFTDAANYMGIGVLLLALIGAWNYRKDPFVIFLIALSTFSLLLSFGKNMPVLYTIFYDVVPAFNKFRAPSMALCLLQFAVPVLAGYGIASVFAWGSLATKVSKKKGLIVGGISIAVFAIMFLFSSDEADYKKQVSDAVTEKQAGRSEQGVSPQYLQIVYNEMKSDATTSGLILLAFGGLVLLVARGTIKPNVAIALFLVLLIGDLWRVDKRPYEPKKGSPEKNVFAKNDIVDFIKRDAGVFRICDLSNTPTPNWWAYHFVENIHGYSSAKLRVYQDVLDVAGPGPGREPVPGNSNILNPFLWNLLNVKYIVSSQPLFQGVEPAFRSQETGALVYINGDVLPRAWFVDTVRVESNKRALLEKLRDGTFNARTTAFVESEFEGKSALGTDSAAFATVAAKSNQHLAVSTSSQATQLLVVSEVFYDEWHAYVDGTEVPMIKTDFVLRGVSVPAGKHTVEFRFISPAFEQGRTISLAANVSALLIGLAGLGLWYRKRKVAAAV